MSDKGYIRLSRGYFDNPLWNEPREYSRAEAWLDLIQSVRFDSSKVILNGRVIELQRGERIASRRFLEARWGWGSTKVINFLELLKANQMITIKQTSGQTIISLCNYSLYNDSQTTEQTTDKPQTNHRQTTHKPKISKESKEKKDNISTPPSPNGDVPPLDDVGECSDSSASPPEPQTATVIDEQEEKKKKLREKEKENFTKFQKWITDNAPRVAMLQAPFTQAEFERLKQEFSITQIQYIITKMHNWKPLLTKCVSANLTFRNWIKKEYDNETTTNTQPINSDQSSAKAIRDATFAQYIAQKLTTGKM